MQNKQNLNGQRQVKKLTYAQLLKKYNERINNPYGKPLTHEDGKPMVVRFEKNGITATIYDECAVVSCLSNQWIAQNTTASYAILYRMAHLSLKPIYDSEKSVDGMMSEGEYNDYACGFLLCYMKCLDLLFIDKNNNINNNILYILYDKYIRYMNNLVDMADKIVEENPEIVAEIIEAETGMTNLMTMQQGLKDINDGMKK